MDPFEKKQQENQRLNEDLSTKRLQVLSAVKQVNDARDKALEVIESMKQAVIKSSNEFMKFIIDNNPEIKIANNEISK